MSSKTLLRTCGIAALVFGALTVVSGGRALFGDAAARAAVGDSVGYVLWFNFLAGFAYVVAGIGIWRARRWAARMAVVLALATAAVAIAFGFHVLAGGAYEMRTVGAMALRVGFWAAVSLIAWKALRPAANPVS